MIVIGSDHAGFRLKEEVKSLLTNLDYEYRDLGCYSCETVDYPDIAEEAGILVSKGECEKGILICGTGIGVSIAANKIKGIRAANCTDCFSAKASRQHNDANILAIGERVVGTGLAMDIINTWLNTEFLGGRHGKRVDKITSLEEKY